MKNLFDSLVWITVDTPLDKPEHYTVSLKFFVKIASNKRVLRFRDYAYDMASLFETVSTMFEKSLDNDPEFSSVYKKGLANFKIWYNENHQLPKDEIEMFGFNRLQG